MEILSPNILLRDSYQYFLKTQHVRKPYWLMLKFNKYAIFSQCAMELDYDDMYRKEGTNI